MNKKLLSWIILIVLSLVWGSSFILMKQGLKAYTSDEVAALRITIASIFMMPFLIKHYNQLNFRKDLKGLVLMGVFGSLIPAFLFTKAETQISSSLTGMLNALTPMFTVIVGVLWFKQKLNQRQLLGVIVGFLGAIALVTLGDGKNDQTTNIIYSLLVALATICYAISVNGIGVYLSETNSIAATVWSFLIIGPIAAIYLFGFTDVIDHTQASPQGIKSLGFISILAIFGSALSIIVYNNLIKMAGTVFAASSTYLIPVAAIAWGLNDGETVTVFQLLAILVIIGGIWIINSSPRIKNDKTLTD
ncbi:MAG: EamA family transporter [Bacteroidia bacterium]|nr:EamA family transporter [Bacteroidia bacterium]